jgi:hypothetical protein
MVANAIKNVCGAMGYARISDKTMNAAIAKLDVEDFILETETKD